MPYCRNCHQEISKFDTDICPYCGERHPIDSHYQTMDVTRGFSSLEGQYELPKAKSLKATRLLCAFLGYFGIHWFYIHRPKRGAVDLLLTLLVVGGIGSLLLFTPLSPVGCYLIPFFALWAVYIAEAIAMGRLDSPKDGRGEFLR